MQYADFLSRLRSFIIITLFFFVHLTAHSSQPANLDTSFGNGGIVSAVFSDAVEQQASLLDNQGRLVIAGASASGSNGRVIHIARFTSDGLPDTSFDVDGTLITSVSGAFIRDLIHHSNGNYYLVGGTDVGMLVMCIDENGAYCPDFGNQGPGIVVMDTTNQLNDWLNKIIEVKTGNFAGRLIVVGTSSVNSSTAGWYVASLSSNRGRLSGGFHKFHFTNNVRVEAEGITQTTNGEFVVAGLGSVGRIALVRFNYDSNPEGTLLREVTAQIVFNTLFQDSGGPGITFADAVNNGNSFLIGGNTSFLFGNGPIIRKYLMRLDANTLSVDTSFAEHGATLLTDGVQGAYRFTP